MSIPKILVGLVITSLCGVKVAAQTGATLSSTALYNFAREKLARDSLYNDIIAELFYRAEFKDAEREDELADLQRAVEEPRFLAIKKRIEQFELGGDNFVVNVNRAIVGLKRELSDCARIRAIFADLRNNVEQKNFERIIETWPQRGVDIAREDQVFADFVKTRIMFLLEKNMSTAFTKANAAQDIDDAIQYYEKALKGFGLKEREDNIVLQKARKLEQLMANIEGRISTTPASAEEAERVSAAIETLIEEYSAADGNMNSTLLRTTKSFIENVRNVFKQKEARARLKLLEDSLREFVNNVKSFLAQKSWSSKELGSALINYQSVQKNLSEYAPLEGADRALINDATQTSSDFVIYLRDYFDTIKPTADNLVRILHDFGSVKDVFDRATKERLQQKLEGFSKQVLLDALKAMDNLVTDEPERVPLGDAFLAAVKSYYESGSKDPALIESLKDTFEHIRTTKDTAEPYIPNKKSLQYNAIYSLIALHKLEQQVDDTAGKDVCSLWKKPRFRNSVAPQDFKTICETYGIYDD